MTESDELAAHVAACTECTPDTIDAEGNAELGSYCQEAVRILLRQSGLLGKPSP